MSKIKPREIAATSPSNLAGRSLPSLFPDGPVRSMGDLAVVQAAFLSKAADLIQNVYIYQSSSEEFFSPKFTRRFKVAAKVDQLKEVLDSGANVTLIFKDSLPAKLLAKYVATLSGKGTLSISCLEARPSQEQIKYSAIWWAGGCSARDGIGHCSVLWSEKRKPHSSEELCNKVQNPNTAAYSDTKKTLLSSDKIIADLLRVMRRSQLSPQTITQDLFQIEGLRDRLLRLPIARESSLNGL